MKRILLFSTLLMMLLFTACQKEGVKDLQQIDAAYPEEFYKLMEQDILDSGPEQDLISERWLEDYMKTLPSEEKFLESIALEEGEVEIREHWICERLMFVARLEPHYGYLSSADIARGNYLINNIGDGIKVVMSDWPQFYIDYGIAQGLSSIATPQDVFNTRDLDYAIYELQDETFDCGISALYN